MRGRLAGVLPTLRLRLVVVFALVALTAAVSASGIAYWLNRDAVLTRTQNAALNDFRKSMEDNAGSLPRRYDCRQLWDAAEKMANTSQSYEVLLTGEDARGAPCTAASDQDAFTMEDVPGQLRSAVGKRRPVDTGNSYPYHLYWQRSADGGGSEPFLVGGAKMIGEGPTPSGFMRKSLGPERDDLNSLAWSLGIATGVALLGAMLLAQAAASTVLRPVRRLGDAARRLGEGKLDTRLKVSGTDELAELSRTFNRTAESLENRVADLSAREESSRRFVADMSHELRTPMTAISAVTEVLEEEQENLDPMIAPAVQIVVSETRRLNDLVENLMEVTRFDAGTANLVLDHVDVADQVTACIDARAWLDAVELDADRGLMVRLDPRRLDVILANLIGNALKHGGSPVRISVRTEESPSGAGELVIEVADRGPGIPEEKLPHVFDRFFKASASRPRSEGSGLGLSIAQENAHIHGGSISARNDPSPEGGAVFTLRLPRGSAGPAPGEGEADEEAEAAAAREEDDRRARGRAEGEDGKGDRGGRRDGR
ncbi:sensor histidine kinase [Streptomyces albidus (ex Kaewkla and Franco 2022)]|uniref:sensor histidine kinase n=1 Tax=Streptomyces albidus (ex Kaewkla and Franco 2022) TaxID=722709 RepID=UPI0015EF6952|nr:HAMP domain-containing sensor histidine kinase [Streptomyces albidus (ex Kaewkla and Franco 2022)]